jgi:UDP-N-acetyl-2-amino-2-deoxyglucuronate dehydrogenase
MPTDEAVATRHKYRDLDSHLVFENSQSVLVACRSTVLLALFPVFGHGFGRNRAQVPKLLDLPSILLVKDIRKLPPASFALKRTCRSSGLISAASERAYMIRFGLLGCGRIARRHADLLGGGLVEGAALAAVCDPIRERADAIASKFGVPADYDIDDFLARADIDAVAVLTPSGMHPEHAIACARAGKHVVVEKPMALRLQDADDMIRACDEAGVKLFIVKQNRFNVPVVRAREALEAGRFGKLILGTVRVRWCRDQAYYDQDKWRGTWAYDGGVLTNQASHHIDMLEWFFGDVVSVHARASTALARIETEDTAVATLKFRNGALGIIEATTATRPVDLEGSLSILGEKGTVEIAGFAVNQIRHWRFADELPSDKDVIEKFSVNPPNVYGFGHQAYYQHVIDCLVQQRAALVDGLEGRKSLELISALYESIETGQEVALRFEPRLSRLGVVS